MAYTPNSICLLKGTFNYFNRKIYFYESLEDYEDLADEYLLKEDINFNPNEGVTTSLVVNVEGADYFKYSYMLVLDEDEEIVSRWFIIDAKRNLKGQFTLSLRRDVVAESFASLTFKEEAPVYVEKGMLSDDDPMIVNSEGINLNQIKKGEILLTDSLEENSTEIGYIVGYFADDASGFPYNATSKTDTSQDIDYVTPSQIASATGIPQSTIISMFTGTVSFIRSNPIITYGTYTGVGTLAWKNTQEIDLNFGDNQIQYLRNFEPAAAWSHAIGGPAVGPAAADLINRQFFNKLFEVRSSLKTNIEDVIQNDFPTEEYLTLSDFNKLRNFCDGKYLYYSSKYYLMSVRQGNTADHTEITISQGENNLFDTIVSAALGGYTEYSGWELYLNYKIQESSISLSEVGLGNAYHVQIPSGVNTLLDAPYRMFVIPYGNITQTVYGNTPADISTKYPTKQELLSLATALALSLGDALIDLQLLPYMPEHSKFIINYNNMDVLALADLTQYSDYVTILNANNERAGAILFPKTCNTSFDIRCPLSLQNSMKIDSQACFYRLCSPNYNGVFEFNLAKDGGEITFFHVDMTCKPYSPFIRVTPDFAFLYGANYKDGRGLICGGDFSLPRNTNAWINYQIQNKNYASIFSREIQNLDFNLQQERFKEPFTIGAGIIGAGAGGAVAGAKVGGGYGAAAGAAVGVAAGTIGGYLDSKLNEARRAETKDYALDRFNLNLGNIKALPSSLARTSAYDINNKLFPFVEFYSASDMEIAALQRKIEYDGMAVGRIDYISNFMGGNNNQKYFKGQLIRALGIYDNEDFVEALYNELAKGVYI